MPTVLYENTDAVATVTLNRPEALNAINLELHEALHAALARAVAEQARVVVLRGAGRSFCAGGDLRAVAAGEDVGDPQRLAQALTSLPMPVVAGVQGHCLGQAFELLQLCDLVVAERSCQFGEVEVQHGWAPPIPVTARSLAPRHAAEVLLLGELFGAPDALRMALVNRVVDDGTLDVEVDRVTSRLRALDPGVLAANKASVRAARG